MSNLIIQQLPAPQACGLCGRPTTRYSPELKIAYCGREERPADRTGGSDDVAPRMQGGEHRRGLRRRRRRQDADLGT